MLAYNEMSALRAKEEKSGGAGAASKRRVEEKESILKI